MFRIHLTAEDKTKMHLLKAIEKKESENAMSSNGT